MHVSAGTSSKCPLRPSSVPMWAVVSDEHIILVVYLWMVLFVVAHLSDTYVPVRLWSCVCIMHRSMSVSGEYTSVQAGDNTMYKDLLENPPQ